MHMIQKLLRVGDTVYSARGGKEMKVLSINSIGFATEEDFFKYEEVRQTFWLTKNGYLTRGGKL